ncbi:Copia protein, partial [Mucuna pruriens]
MKTYHPKHHIFRNVQDKVRTRPTFKDQVQVALLSKVEPKSIEDALLDEGWIKAMQEELDQFQKNDIFKNKLDENEVDVKQPPSFESDAFPNHVFKLKNALHGLKQVSRAWYEKLSSFLMSNGFERGKIDTTLFHINYNSHFITVQIYVEDIIFGATNETLCEKFSELMQKEFKMSMVGELKFFLGLQIKQVEDETYIHQTKHIKELLNMFNLEDCKSMSTVQRRDIVL